MKNCQLHIDGWSIGHGKSWSEVLSIAAASFGGEAGIVSSVLLIPARKLVATPGNSYTFLCGRQIRIYCLEIKRARQA